MRFGEFQTLKQIWLAARKHRGSYLLGLLLMLAAFGLMEDLGRILVDFWQKSHRAVVFYRKGIRNGIAISLNTLEKQQQTIGPLPRMKILGVLLEPSDNDWILFGETDSGKPELPIDVVTVALRALRLHLEAPGIDIRPQASPALIVDSAQKQTVSYFGGVSGNIVGAWFFRFDYWMKRTSLAQEPVSLSDVPVYWNRAVEQLENDIKNCTGTLTEQRKRNRWWLCAGEFKAMEDGEILVFEETPLRVLAEGVSDGKQEIQQNQSPCVSQGSDDPVASEFADWLTEHLPDLSRTLPVAEIEGFARLMAGFGWLMEQDPYRNLNPWLNKPLLPVDTPDSVDSVTMQSDRQHEAVHHGRPVLHHHSLAVSGGVLVAPSIVRAKVADRSLLSLYETIVGARGTLDRVIWSFSYIPSKN